MALAGQPAGRYRRPVRTRNALAIVGTVCFVAGCTGDEDPTDDFKACVVERGGTVGDDTYVATDENGRPLAVVGDVDLDEATVNECLALVDPVNAPGG